MQTVPRLFDGLKYSFKLKPEYISQIKLHKRFNIINASFKHCKEFIAKNIPGKNQPGFKLESRPFLLAFPGQSPYPTIEACGDIYRNNRYINKYINR